MNTHIGYRVLLGKSEDNKSAVIINNTHAAEVASRVTRSRGCACCASVCLRFVMQRSAQTLVRPSVNPKVRPTVICFLFFSDSLLMLSDNHDLPIVFDCAACRSLAAKNKDCVCKQRPGFFSFMCCWFDLLSVRQARLALLFVIRFGFCEISLLDAFCCWFDLVSVE